MAAAISRRSLALGVSVVAAVVVAVVAAVASSSRSMRPSQGISNRRARAIGANTASFGSPSLAPM